jgi:hypothetical protein
MAQEGQQLGLALELAFGFGRDEEVLLDGHLNAKALIEASVDGAHSPGAEQLKYSVSIAENAVQFEGHGALRSCEICEAHTGNALDGYA